MSLDADADVESTSADFCSICQEEETAERPLDIECHDWHHTFLGSVLNNG